MKTGRLLTPSVEDMIKALKLCAADTLQDDYPCKGCYLYPFSKDGHMSTGRTCFEHLTLDVSDALTRLNDFSQSQCAKLLAENSRLTAQVEQLEAELAVHWEAEQKP